MLSSNRKYLHALCIGMVVYVDDFVACFQYKEEAEERSTPSDSGYEEKTYVNVYAR